MALRRITGDKKYSLLATVPNGMLIKPGVKAQVDGVMPEGRSVEEAGLPELDRLWEDVKKEERAAG